MLKKVEWLLIPRKIKCTKYNLGALLCSTEYNIFKVIIKQVNVFIKYYNYIIGEGEICVWAKSSGSSIKKTIRSQVIKSSNSRIDMLLRYIKTNTKSNNLWSQSNHP